MTELTVMQAYATSIESKVYLANRGDWLTLDNKSKDDALLWGRYYIDAHFDCVVDADAIPDEVKFANSLLAYDYFTQGDLFFDNQSNVIMKRVKAGSVETETEYQSGVHTRPNSLSKVVSILSSLCNNTQGVLVRV